MTLEDVYAKMTLEDEDQGVELKGDEALHESEDYRFCLIGRFFTDKSINFGAMKITLPSISRPVKGVCIKDLGAGYYVFQFSHPIDMKRVLESGPWSFDQHLLLLKHLHKNENPLKVELVHSAFWVKVHDVPAGFRSEKFLIHVGNYIGQLISSDPNNFAGGWNTFLRVRVLIDIHSPITRKMKFRKAGGDWVCVTFKYEKLPAFCFFCGKIGHSDKFFETLFEMPADQIDQLERPYGPWLRAPVHLSAGQMGDRWLREGSMARFRL